MEWKRADWTDAADVRIDVDLCVWDWVSRWRRVIVRAALVIRHGGWSWVGTLFFELNGLSASGFA